MNQLHQHIKSLEDCVNKALRQIEEKRYDTALVDAGIASSRIMHLGIGFDGKRVLVSSEGKKNTLLTGLSSKEGTYQFGGISYY